MALAPIMMDDVDLIIGDIATGPNFKCQLTAVTLKPDAQVQTLRTLCPAGVFNKMSTPTWTLELGYANFVDVGTPDTVPVLAEFLFDNAGDVLPFTFRPITGGDGWSGDVLIIPGAVGGSKDGYAEQSVTLSLDGQPAKVAGV